MLLSGNLILFNFNPNPHTSDLNPHISDPNPQISDPNPHFSVLINIIIFLIVLQDN